VGRFSEGEGSHAPKYNSQELDLETGYYFYNARHYDPEISRFVTADNVIDGEFDTQGWNRYSYTKGNPIIYKDPTGHWTLQFGVSFSTSALSSKSSGVVVGYSEEYGLQITTYKEDSINTADAGVSLQVKVSGNKGVHKLEGKSIEIGKRGEIKGVSVAGHIDIPINEKGDEAIKDKTNNGSKPKAKDKSKNSEKKESAAKPVYTVEVGVSTKGSATTHGAVSETEVKDNGDVSKIERAWDNLNRPSGFTKLLEMLTL